jgi:hypothetical protein
MQRQRLGHHAGFIRKPSVIDTCAAACPVTSLTAEQRTAMLAEFADDNARTCATWTKGRTTLFSEPDTATAQPAISLDAARTHIETLLPTARAALDSPT